LKEIEGEKEDMKRVKHQKDVNRRVARSLPSKKSTAARDAERKAERKRMAQEEALQSRELANKRNSNLSKQAPIWERTRMDMVRLRAQDTIEEIMMQTGASTH